MPGADWNTTNQIVGESNANQVQGNTATTQGQTTNTNLYNPAQNALQGQVPSLYQTLLAGSNIPKSFVAPQAVIDNYNQQFDTWSAPQIAVNGGANSPMIAANKAIGESNLLANLYNQGVGNYLSALGGATSSAMTPIGQTAQSNNAATSAGTLASSQNYEQNQNQTYAALQSLLDILQQVPGT